MANLLKNPEGAKLILAGGGGNQKALSMLGGAGKDTVTPETTNNKGTGTLQAGSGGRGFRSKGDAHACARPGVHKPSSLRLLKKEDSLAR